MSPANCSPWTAGIRCRMRKKFEACPRRREDMERVTGSMGSEYVRFRLDPEAVPMLTEKFDWNLLARRVFIDSGTGFVGLVRPSTTHERHTRGMDRVMDAIARRGFLSRRWAPRAGAGRRTRAIRGPSPMPATIWVRRPNAGTKHSRLTRMRRTPLRWRTRPISSSNSSAAAATVTSRSPTGASASRKCGASTYRAMSARPSC